MALKIRLQRHGASHAPVYRMVVTESSHRRDGRFNEILGHYNPKARGKEVEVKIKLDRVDYWLSVGAQATDTAKHLIKRARKAPAVEEVAAAPAAATEAPAEAAPAESAE